MKNTRKKKNEEFAKLYGQIPNSWGDINPPQDSILKPYEQTRRKFLQLSADSVDVFSIPPQNLLSKAFIERYTLTNLKELPQPDAIVYDPNPEQTLVD